MNRLYRNETDGVWMGVLTGFADYIEADPAIVRLIYAFVTLLTGVFLGVIFYLVAGMCIPKNPDDIRRENALRSIIRDRYR